MSCFFLAHLDIMCFIVLFQDAIFFFFLILFSLFFCRFNFWTVDKLAFGFARRGYSRGTCKAEKTKAVVEKLFKIPALNALVVLSAPWCTPGVMAIAVYWSCIATASASYIATNLVFVLRHWGDPKRHRQGVADHCQAGYDGLEYYDCNRRNLLGYRDVSVADLTHRAWCIRGDIAQLFNNK